MMIAYREAPEAGSHTRKLHFLNVFSHDCFHDFTANSCQSLAAPSVVPKQNEHVILGARQNCDVRCHFNFKAALKTEISSKYRKNHVILKIRLQRGSGQSCNYATG